MAVPGLDPGEAIRRDIVNTNHLASAVAGAKMKIIANDPVVSHRIMVRKRDILNLRICW